MYIFLECITSVEDCRSEDAPDKKSSETYGLQGKELYIPTVVVDISSEHYRSIIISLKWRHNGRDSVPNHQPHDCFLNRLFRHISRETSKLRVTGLCAGNSPEAGEFPAQTASNAENVSIWWRHNDVFVASYSENMLRVAWQGTPRTSHPCNMLEAWILDMNWITKLW